MRTQIVSNRFGWAKREARRGMNNGLAAAADELRDVLSEALDGGSLPIQSDTDALSESLAVQTRGGSDAKARTAAAKTRYTTGESKYRDVVKSTLATDAYEASHFDERVATEEPLPNGEMIAAVLTLLAWGAWWELGHNNRLTGRSEQRAWMQPLATTWAFANMEKHFANLFK